MFERNVEEKALAAPERADVALVPPHRPRLCLGRHECQEHVELLCRRHVPTERRGIEPQEFLMAAAWMLLTEDANVRFMRLLGVEEQRAR